MKLENNMALGQCFIEDLIPEISQFLIKGGDALCTTLK